MQSALESCVLFTFVSTGTSYGRFSPVVSSVNRNSIYCKFGYIAADSGILSEFESYFLNQLNAIFVPEVSKVEELGTILTEETN